MSLEVSLLGSGLTNVPIRRLLQRLQEVRHTPVEIGDLELVRVVCGHARYESDDGFPNDDLLAIAVFECEIADLAIVFGHGLVVSRMSRSQVDGHTSCWFCSMAPKASIDPRIASVELALTRTARASSKIFLYVSVCDFSRVLMMSKQADMSIDARSRTIV